MPLSERIETAFVYGSVAKGEDRANSDVDVLFIGDAGLAEIAKALKPLERRFGREFSARCYSAAEFAVKLEAGNHFLRTVIREPKLFLIGTDDDIRRLAGEPMDQPARDKQG